MSSFNPGQYYNNPNMKGNGGNNNWRGERTVTISGDPEMVREFMDLNDKIIKLKEEYDSTDEVLDRLIKTTAENSKEFNELRAQMDRIKAESNARMERLQQLKKNRLQDEKEFKAIEQFNVRWLAEITNSKMKYGRELSFDEEMVELRREQDKFLEEQRKIWREESQHQQKPNQFTQQYQAQGNGQVQPFKAQGGQPTQSPQVFAKNISGNQFNQDFQHQTDGYQAYGRQDNGHRASDCKSSLQFTNQSQGNTQYGGYRQSNLNLANQHQVNTQYGNHRQNDLSFANQHQANTQYGNHQQNNLNLVNQPQANMQMRNQYQGSRQLGEKRYWN